MKFKNYPNTLIEKFGGETNRGKERESERSIGVEKETKRLRKGDI